MKVFVILLMILSSSVATRLLSSDELHQRFVKFGRNATSETDIKEIQDVLEIYSSASAALETQYKSNSRTTLACMICRSAFSALFDLVHEGQSDETLIESVTVLCTSLGFVAPTACKGLIALNVPIITYIIRHTPEAAPRTFCGLVMQNVGDPNHCFYDDPRFEWQVDLPEPVNIQKRVSSSSTEPLTIALISDAHVDPLYEPDGVADCDQPTCCRKGQTPRTIPKNIDIDDTFFEGSIVRISGNHMLDLDVADAIREKKRSLQKTYARNVEPAGFWGDYRSCDSPIWAYDDVIERMASAHKNIDVIYYMGDSIDHHVWETTYELISEVNAYIVEKMRKEFGDNVVILPVIGNHESQPTNQFAPSSITEEKLNTTWLYTEMAKKWSFYLNEEAKSSLSESGGFSMLVRPGLRVISININIAYKNNWWLVYDPLQAKKHMEWLIDELYKAELAGEMVHILSHIPPGVHDLIQTWTREYNRVVRRFSSTIKAEFNGHTHSDEFKIFYDENGNPINMAWGAGSATAYSNYNLNYKIATFNPNTFEPLNIVNYVYNLTEANLTPNRRPHWFQLYDIKNNFGITDLTAKSMDDLVHKMVTEKLLLLDFYSAFYSKLSDTRWPYCNIYCKIDNLCKTVVTVLWQRQKCDELRELLFS